LSTRTRFTVAALAALSLVGCLRAPGGLAPSTSPLEGRTYQILGKAMGSATQYHILGMIPTSQAVMLQQAVDDAKGKAGADALIEVTSDYYVKDFVLFSSTTTEVRGKAIKFTDGK
jgi:hypothetical protein